MHARANKKSGTGPEAEGKKMVTDSLHSVELSPAGKNGGRKRSCIASHTKPRSLVLPIIAVFGMFFFTFDSGKSSTNKKKLRKFANCHPKLGIRPLKNREEMPQLLNEHNLTTGIEIGVKQGHFAKHVLDGWSTCKKYHLVDLWGEQQNYKDVANVNNETHNKFYLETLENIAAHRDRVEIHRMLSTEASKLFPKESIDFIYVDARHDYCAVMEDLMHYWPILKPGGIMSGHDYNENSEVRGQDWGLCADGTRHDMAVKGAVNDFFLKKGLTITVTYYRQNNFMSWIVKKPLC
jgi:hypothetical protein